MKFHITCAIIYIKSFHLKGNHYIKNILTKTTVKTEKNPFSNENSIGMTLAEKMKEGEICL